MALPRESHSREIRSLNLYMKTIYENIVQLHALTRRLLVWHKRDYSNESTKHCGTNCYVKQGSQLS